jgi:carbamoyl-phosphate synthase large subunit
LNVLVTSAGTASAVNVIKALRRQQEYAVRILAVDADVTAPGLYLADEHAIVPRCSQNDYIPSLVQFCEEYQIQALFPIYSKEIEVIAEYAPRFRERGINLLLPKPDVVRLCNDKRRMYTLAGTLGIHTPRLIADGVTATFPLFVKPNTASGTSDVMRINDEADLAYVKSKHPDFLYQEFVQGPEYTVDVLCDRQSDVIVAAPRLRLATRAGQSVKGRTVEEPVLVALCTKLCKAVGVVGPCNIQFIQRGSEFILIELNPRYAAGGLMLTVHAGANIPLLALKLMLGGSVSPPVVRRDMMMLRYWEEVFINV